MDALKLARYIIAKSIEEKSPVTNLQLQGILYFVQAAHLKKHGSPAINGEFVAMPSGPAILRVYYQYAHFGTMEIVPLSEKAYIPPEFETEQDRALIDKVIKQKRSIPKWQLTAEILKDSAWSEAYKRGKRQLITNEMIRRSFE